MEGAINLAYNSTNNVTQFGIGAKYNLDNDANLRAKVNSNLQIGLGYQQKLRNGNYLKNIFVKKIIRKRHRKIFISAKCNVNPL